MLSFILPTAKLGRLWTRSVVRTVSQSSTISRAIVHQVYPSPNIKITSNYNLNIKSYDVIDCPDGNILRISLQPKSELKQSIAPNLMKFLSIFDATVQIDDRNIAIDTSDNFVTELNADELLNAVICLIEVPLKSNLKVFSKRNVNVQNMHGEDINVTSSDGDVTTKNIQSVNLNLVAQNGNIQCDGTTLARKMDIRSFGEKKIHLNQMLGESLTAISENGIISTNSCYVENSRFITQTGGLHLKNVHKKSELYMLNGGNLEVTGFHGILNATTCGGTLNYQLTEIYGESFIEARNPTKFHVNISEFVEQNTCLAINANTIELDSTLQHFETNKKKEDSGEELRSGNADTNDDRLTIRSDGQLKLGKLSWMETIQLKMGAQRPK